MLGLNTYLCTKHSVNDSQGYIGGCGSGAVAQGPRAMQRVGEVFDSGVPLFFISHRAPAGYSNGPDDNNEQRVGSKGITHVLEILKWYSSIFLSSF